MYRINGVLSSQKVTVRPSLWKVGVRSSDPSVLP